MHQTKNQMHDLQRSFDSPITLHFGSIRDKLPRTLVTLTLSRRARAHATSAEGIRFPRGNEFPCNIVPRFTLA